MPWSNRVSWIALLLAFLAALLFQPEYSASDVLSSHGNVLLLTAHPDDECLFFAPTIQAVTRANTPVYSLCLSIGDADGLGSVRREEFGRSLDVLGVPKDRRWVIDHPDLQDNFTKYWDAETIADAIYPYILSHNISTILTFDADGISDHPNHKSLPAGATYLLTHRSTELPTLPRLYSLITRSIIPKYAGILAPIASKFSLSQERTFPVFDAHISQLYRALQLAFTPNPNTKTHVSPQPVLVSGIPEYLTALQAMRAHASQLVWFRWLYVLFSRYMWVNEWVELRLDD
ncbi:putative glcNAc-PI de-N-acetylase [Lyophyllum shimeji]|uniref:N-acetylglucosaminylphosphatidylinositol deacetylase n=1 Tax=Lyophyllum shimeji TaxID=47721 RepID=A0A9P3UNJ8_LYOSH|nr:putative glcNAc-PI de-N-acetylase [Lyophyllum shimeji]